MASHERCINEAGPDADLPAPTQSALFALLSLMEGLTDEERVEVYREMGRHYCPRCGEEMIPTGRSTCRCELARAEA